MRKKVYILKSDSTLCSWLKQRGYEVKEVLDQHLSHKPLKQELPLAFADRIIGSHLNILSAHCSQEDLIIAALKCVACGRRIVQIPHTEEQAYATLKLLSGRRHQVLSLLAVYYKGKVSHRVALTRISFKHLSDRELQKYVDSQAWKNKIAGYDPLDKGGDFIKSVNGSLSGIVGIPFYELNSLLESINSAPER